jgi:glycosyltransferase involved in cell wall biosynthesis
MLKYFVMKKIDNNQFQYRTLRALYKTAPFSLKGAWEDDKDKNIQKDFISCLAIASYRPKELEWLLEDLADQDLPREKFEVIVLNDGAGEEIRSIVEKFTDHLTIVYQENAVPCRIISDLRNETLRLSKGQYILFLDDDTRILQKDFLSKTLDLFSKNDADIITPHGNPLFGLVKLKYCYLNEYSFGNCCCLYKRDVLSALGGFQGGLNSYEDIELSIRASIHDFKVYRTDQLDFYHPPFYFYSMKKPLSIGQSIFQIRKHYSFLVWLCVYLNALRFLPYCILPGKIPQQWFRISLGVLMYPVFKENFFY